PAVIGSGTDADGHFCPMRWENGNGMRPVTPSIGIACAASADGSIIAGCVESDGGGEAFVWTPMEGEQRLGFLDGGGASSAKAMSPDACTIVGVSGSWNGTQAFRFRCDGGMEG